MHMCMRSVVRCCAAYYADLSAVYAAMLRSSSLRSALFLRMYFSSTVGTFCEGYCMNSIQELTKGACQACTHNDTIIEPSQIFQDHGICMRFQTLQGSTAEYSTDGGTHSYSSWTGWLVQRMQTHTRWGQEAYCSLCNYMYVYV